MSFDSKLNSIVSIIENHNTVIGGKDQKGYVDFEEFSKKLKILGATTEEILKSLSHEEILDCLPSFDNVKPKLLAKEIAKVFRGKETLTSVNLSSRRVDALSLEELISIYDPKNPNSNVGKKLAEESKNLPFLVFNPDGTIWIEKSLLLLNELRQGYPPRELFLCNSNVFRIYKVGDNPENYVNENPIYHGRALRLDETCDQTNRSWEGVPLEVRQLVHIITSNTRRGTCSLEEANNFIDICVSIDAFQKLGQRYPTELLLFKESKSVGTLPTLKIKLNQNQSEKNSNNGEFWVGKKITLENGPLHFQCNQCKKKERK